MTPNLVDGLHKQMARARELQKLYDTIPGGVFGAGVVASTIQRAEQSIASGDVVEMLQAYNALEALE